MAEEELELERLGGDHDNDGYDYDDDDETTPLIETPKPSTGRETLRPKQFHETKEKLNWGVLKTPQLENNISNAWKIIKENFPDIYITKKINANINESGEITIKIGDRKNAVEHILFDYDGDMNENIPQKVKDILGEQISKKG